MLKALNNSKSKALLYSTFTLYMVILVWIVIFKVNYHWVTEIRHYYNGLTIAERLGKSIIPGYTIIKAYRTAGIAGLDQHFLNVLAFLPLGILLPFFINKKPYLFTTVATVSLTLFFELEQLFSGIGSYDSSDLLTNTLGGIIGMLLYKVLFQKLSDRDLNYTSLVINIIATPIAVYAIVNTILHFDLYLL